MTEAHIHREIAHIAVPVGLEMIVQLLLGVIDQIIIAALGIVAISAVGLVNSVLGVIGITLGALGSGASILVARAHGGEQALVIARVSSTAVALALGLTLLMAAPFLACVGPFLRIIGAAPAVAAAAHPYFQVALLTLVPSVVGMTASATLRSLGQARVPLTATFLAVAVNTLFGYLLVFGVGLFPKLGLVGAAWATFGAQSVKALIVLSRLYGKGAFVAWLLPATLAEWRRTSRDILRLSIPLGAKDVSWSLGLFVYTLIFQRLGIAVLAASQIVSTLENLFMLASIGLMVAATTLIGQAVGRGDPDLAQARVKTLLRIGTITGLGFGTLYLGTAFLLPVFYRHVGPGVLHIAAWGIVISAGFQAVRVRNIILGGGVLPSGGDTRTVIIGDFLGSFALGLPLACLLAFGLHWGVWGVFAARGAEELSKALFFTHRAGRLCWADVAVRLKIAQ